MATRTEVLLRGYTRTTPIVEIGPSFQPVAPRQGGWNTKIIDIATKTELLEVYSGYEGLHAVEEVDFLWREGSLITAVPAEYHGTFEVLVASHIIEHLPDLLDFFDSAERLLTPAGSVILAVPDKRLCFNYFLPTTTTGDVLSRRGSTRRHDGRMIFNHYAYFSLVDDAPFWGPERIGDAALSFGYPLHDAHANFANSGCGQSLSSYVEVHAWHFTPASFELLLLELARLGLTDWRVTRSEPTNGCQFYAWLDRGGRAAAASLSLSDLESRRLALLRRMLLETREQLDLLLPDRRPATSKLLAELQREKLEKRALHAELASMKSALAASIATNSELALQYYADAAGVSSAAPASWRVCGDALKQAGLHLEAEIAHRRAVKDPVSRPLRQVDDRTAGDQAARADLAAAAAGQNPTVLFSELIAREQPGPVLEIGTRRDREEVPTHHFSWFPHLSREDYVMADLAVGLDVDRTADLHALPAAWRGHFGACVAVAVFEHLQRPWIAAREMYLALRPNGLCFVATHQTYPLHGFPEDYFRFSQEALALIFRDAGFDVLSVGYADRTKIIMPEACLPSGLSDIWNEGNPSYASVLMVARRPAVDADTGNAPDQPAARAAE